jgi:uncharacterized membrane protein YbhN (UPF0104 family)
MPVEAWANTVRSLLRPDRLAWAVLNAQRGQGLRPCCCRACGPPWSALRTVAASPVKLILLAGGSALITLAYIGGLAASVQAFGGHAGITEIGAVYLGAAVIAAASPTPGGLGAIEAALVAGLTGIGVSPGSAVSAVLTYRLATYWLPVIPGWAAWRLLQRRDYV